FYNTLVIEPAGSEWLTADGSDDLSVPLDPARGVGTNMMITGANDAETHPDHREFMLAVADFAVVYDPTLPETRCPDAIGPLVGSGCPVNGPEAPESISAEDPGTFLVNYKHEPIPLRVGQFDNDGSFLGLKPGLEGDMARVFDSTVHGDPFTEMFKAYEGDNVTVRLIQGAQEEQHVFRINGMRWKREQNNPDSAYVNAQPIGISEHFEADVPDLPEVRRGASIADYLYSFAATDNLWNGTWGLIRTFKDSETIDPASGLPVGDSLAELPDSPGRIQRSPRSMGFRSDGCPSSAPRKSFSVEAWAAQDLLPGGELVYNAREGIADPSGLLLINTADRSALMAGTKQPEPLVLRANAGDCIRMVLRNRLPVAVPDHLGDARVPPITAMQTDDFRPGNSVGLNPQLVSYDIRTSDGANVGLNGRVQTAAPGRVVAYTWYAGTIEVVPDPAYPGADKRTKVATPQEFGTINLAPFGDVIKQGVQGLVGMLVIEPEGATYHDPETGAPINSGTSATIRYQKDGLPSEFKEFVVLYQGGMNLLEFGADMPDNFIADDPEDEGERGINYRTEPFCARLGKTADCDTNADVYPNDFLMSAIETPEFRAEPGDEIRFRVGFPSGPARQSTFSVYGHDYPDQGQPNAFASGVSLIAPGVATSAVPYEGAQEGTWVMRPGPTFHFGGGAWGRLKVESEL
ncbi:MAG: copper oxidase, partial [Candidatus Thiodiazotropha sp. (ex Semelilucina semeliformis)]|nr:copper oxidase [Candidatus Thiodiazotropha sp. (ex Semelilucina semeliformis)]